MLDRDGTPKLKPGDTRYLRVEIGPGGELKATVI